MVWLGRSQNRHWDEESTEQIKDQDVVVNDERLEKH
jgi:hypothetical protein